MKGNARTKMTYEETQELLVQMIDDLPQEIFEGLNGGVSLHHDTKYGKSGLLTLGTYHFEPYGLGRYISIFYGSLMASFSHLTPEKYAEKVKGVLHHELIHHLEHLAGDKSLEIKDAENVSKMLRRLNN